MELKVMVRKNIYENKEILDLKNKCKAVQENITRIVNELPVRNNKESQSYKAEEENKNEKTRK